MIAVRGLAEVARKIRQIGEEGERILSREVVATALDVMGEARQILTDTKAVDTGRLRNSVTVAEKESDVVLLSNQATGGPPGSGGGQPAPTMVRAGMLNAVIGSNVDYALHIHYGARSMPARPFLVPAVERHRPLMLGRLEKSLKKLERM